MIKIFKTKYCVRTLYTIQIYRISFKFEIMKKDYYLELKQSKGQNDE